MESQIGGPMRAGAARAQLQAAREVHDASVRRAMVSPGLILATSALCGVLSVPSRYKGPAGVVSILAVLWFLFELLRMSARNQWRSWVSRPKAKGGITEALLFAVAILVGAVVGPQFLLDQGHTTLASWGLGLAVAVAVAACLFTAQACYRRRAGRVFHP